jgi:hypothetical protein
MLRSERNIVGSSVTPDWKIRYEKRKRGEKSWHHQQNQGNTITSHRKLLHAVRRSARPSFAGAEDLLLPLTSRLCKIWHGEEGSRYARSLLLDDSFTRLILSSSE